MTLQIEYDEKELRREITFAIKNIHGIRYVFAIYVSFYRASAVSIACYADALSLLWQRRPSHSVTLSK